MSVDSPRRPGLLMVANAFHPAVGGYEGVARFLAEGLSRDYNVTVVTDTVAGADWTFPFSVVRGASAQDVRQMGRFADLIVMNSISLHYLKLLYPFRRRIVVVHHTGYEEAGTPLIWLLEQIKRAAGSLCRLNICVSRFVSRRIRGPRLVIHNPYDERLFTRGANDRQQAILFVGRLALEKGADILIEAFATLHAHRHEWSLTIVGDGTERLALEQLVKSKALQDVVRFVGVGGREEVAAQMKVHPVLVVPSRREPFGIVALEGLASGCRVVHSDCGGLPEAAGGHGIVFNAGNVQSLTHALSRAMDDVKESGCAISSELARFLETHSTSRVISTYRDALSCRAPGSVQGLTK